MMKTIAKITSLTHTQINDLSRVLFPYITPLEYKPANFPLQLVYT